ncbi:MAG: putative cell wall-binding protein, partial [Glaciecola sp.]
MHLRLRSLLVGVLTLTLASANTLATAEMTGLQQEPASATADCVSNASSRHQVERLSGETRWETAACVAQFAYPEGSAQVILARGDEAGGWADALAGTVLSLAIDAPVLLTPPGELDGATRDEIQRLGATEIIVLGGPGAISDEVLVQLRDLAPVVRRIAGSGRADTAAQIATEAGVGNTAF